MKITETKLRRIIREAMRDYPAELRDEQEEATHYEQMDDPEFQQKMDSGHSYESYGLHSQRKEESDIRYYIGEIVKMGQAVAGTFEEAFGDVVGPPNNTVPEWFWQQVNAPMSSDWQLWCDVLTERIDAVEQEFNRQQREKTAKYRNRPHPKGGVGSVTEGTPLEQMPAAWRQILGGCLKDK